LIDQLRSVDKGRVRRVFGRVDASELKAIDEGLVLFLGLGQSRTRPGPTADIAGPA
jgi:hypothetical protein